MSVNATNIAEFANNIDLDELAHYVPPHPGLHCLHSPYYIVWT